jgi:hypothetical protein
VLETVAALKKEGHECVEFEIPERKLLSMVPNALIADLMVLYRNACDGNICCDYVR